MKRHLKTQKSLRLAKYLGLAAIGCNTALGTTLILEANSTNDVNTWLDNIALNSGSVSRILLFSPAPNGDTGSILLRGGLIARGDNIDLFLSTEGRSLDELVVFQIPGSGDPITLLDLSFTHADPQVPSESFSHSGSFTPTDAQLNDFRTSTFRVEAAITPIPEPSSMGLLLLSSAFLLKRKRLI